MNIADRYDSLPYPTKFFAETNPNRMAALGKILGLDVPDPQECRVLEFGCGDGSNLLSHAAMLPGSKFLGVDISTQHIKTAKAWADEIGLSNIDFQQADLMDMDVSEYGEFDFIVAHGLISWVPRPVIDKVFELFGAFLSDAGIGYVSYNTYPGGHLRNMVREMIVYHTRGIDDPLDKVESASSFLKLLSEGTADQNVYKAVLAAENIRHSKHSPSDFFHDDLSDFYFSFYFSEIASRLDSSGLEYLCESEFHSMSQRTLSPEYQKLIKGIENPVEREDYLDFARGRQFRKTLFCKKGRTVSREIKPARLSELALASTAAPGVMNDVEKESKPVRFQSQLGAGIEIDHVLTKLALTELGSRDGAPVGFPELLDAVRDRLEFQDWNKEEDICRRILIRLLEDTPIVDLYSFSDSNTPILAEKPKASALAQWQTRVGTKVTSRNGAVIGLDDEVARTLVKLSDGSRTIAQIEDGIRKFVAREGIGREVRSDLGEWVRESIERLSRIGVLDSGQTDS